MVGDLKNQVFKGSWKNLFFSSLLSAPIALAIYFWCLQPANFISKRYIAAAILIWIVLAAGSSLLIRPIRKLITSLDQRLVWICILFCLLTVSMLGEFVIGFEKTPYNLFLLPKHSLLIENSSEDEADVVELIYLVSGLGDESFSKFSPIGTWTRLENSLMVQGTQKAALYYEGWLVEKPVLGFQAQPNGGKVNIYWDGQLEQISLYSSLPYQKRVSTLIDSPIFNKLAVLIPGLFTIAMGLFPLLLLFLSFFRMTPKACILFFSFLELYMFFFIYPVFLNSARTMLFSNYVPANNIIGWDLHLELQAAKELVFSSRIPGITYSPYPPLVYILIAPLTFLNGSSAYGIVTIMSVLCYLFITLILPVKLSKKYKISLPLVLILITGLFSYGFQFELERGQTNVIVMCLCLLSVYIFHHYKKQRFWAYVLFSIAVQFKLYPAIFIFLFIEDWNDWKGNIIRFTGLGIANILALFTLGLQPFKNFIDAIALITIGQDAWVGNHSIHSFAGLDAGHRPLGISFENPAGVEILFLMITMICFGSILFQAYRQKKTGINPSLVLACTLCALLIPATSHDYTLSILAAPMALLLVDKEICALHTGWIRPLLLICLICAYCSTLFSYTAKPEAFQNNLPALMAMMVILVFISWPGKSGSTNQQK